MKRVSYEDSTVCLIIINVFVLFHSDVCIMDEFTRSLALGVSWAIKSEPGMVDEYRQRTNYTLRTSVS